MEYLSKDFRPSALTRLCLWDVGSRSYSRQTGLERPADLSTGPAISVFRAERPAETQQRSMEDGEGLGRPRGLLQDTASNRRPRMEVPLSGARHKALPRQPPSDFMKWGYLALFHR